MPKLKPCPFCGGEAKSYVKDYGDTHYWRVSCSSARCGVNPVTNVYHAEAKAIYAWNTRAEEIVRCRDCRYYGNYNGSWCRRTYEPVPNGIYDYQTVEPDGFCKWGIKKERRNEEANQR